MSGNNKALLKKTLVFALIIIFFFVLSYAFMPRLLDGKIVNQSDISGYLGMSHEMSEYNASHPGEEALWTGSMFSGMPTTPIHASSKGDLTQWLYDFLMNLMKRPACYLFICLVGAFLLMLSLGISIPLSVGGAVAVAFCSYNFQIIQVGHNTKMQAIAFAPWVLAALISTYKAALGDGRKKAAGEDAPSGKGKWRPAAKTLLFASLFGLALSLQVKANHQQITYYLAMMVLLYAVAVFIDLMLTPAGRTGTGKFFAASAALLVAGGLGIATNTVKLAPLYSYSQYTMRGGSELSSADGKEVNDKGLDIDYATAWSYGWNEMPNMMIANFNGGSTVGKMDPDKSETAKLLRNAGQKNYAQVASQLPLYWGGQPFTAGPMYMGAISVFLFVLGLCLYKGRDKWWLIVCTILAVFMAAGSHFMWFTKLCFKYLPLYGKFRSVSMALTVLQLTLPMLGFLVLDRILRSEYDGAAVRKGLVISWCLTAGICLIFAIFPSLAGSFASPSDSSYGDVLSEALRADRRHLLSTDAWVSFFLISAAAALVFWGLSSPKSAPKSYESDPHIGRARRFEAAAGIGLLILVNMFATGKRYLDNDDFITPKDFTAHFNQRPVDKIILQDESPSYRVVDLTADVFNSADASYWHKNIGGYSPAKLQRYQDLISKYLIPELNSVYAAMKGISTLQELQERMPQLPVVSALNCRYVIVGEEIPPVVIQDALGNAWFADSLVRARTPDEELDMTGKVDLGTTMVIGADFAGAADGMAALVPAGDNSSDRISLVSYSPNKLVYHYSTSAPRAAVFSEIYYPDGWTAEVDGKEEVDIFRADWTLRGVVLPGGEHELVMSFRPRSNAVSENVSKASSIALLLLLLLSACAVYGCK